MEQNRIQNEEPSNDVLVELQSVLKKYLAEKPNRSMNGLSRKCVVSEPTLRRIYRGQIKTMPTATTVLDILTTISKEKNLQAIRKLYPGAISDYLDSNLPQAQDVDTEYSLELNNELNDSNSYLIYKLSSNSRGLKKEKLLELLGTHGVKKAEILLQKGYLSLSANTYFAQVKNFTLNHSTFIQNFKCVADFLKTQSPVSKNNTHSLLVNYSESVSLDTYREIIAIQKKALKKIRDLMSDENAQGEIPLCLLLAVDTLDTKSVHEFEK